MALGSTQAGIYSWEFRNGLAKPSLPPQQTKGGPGGPAPWAENPTHAEGEHRHTGLSTKTMFNALAVLHGMLSPISSLASMLVL